MALIRELKKEPLVNSSIIWLVLFCVSFTAMARKRIAVETIDEVSPVIQQKYPHVQFKTTKDAPKSEIPSLSEREQYFKNLGLNEELKSMDEADKDILYYRLRNSSVAKLKAWYPKFPKSIWKKREKK